MKLLLENWRTYLAESEETEFPWLAGLRQARTLEDQQEYLEKPTPGFQELGEGAFRRVYAPLQRRAMTNIPALDQDYVIKIVHGFYEGETKMNKEDFEVSKRYPLIFPKVYAHDDYFNWIIMERINTIKGSDGFGKMMRKSFKNEIEALQSISDGELGAQLFSDTGVAYGDFYGAHNVHSYDGLLDAIISSFRLDRRGEPNEPGPETSLLQKALSKAPGMAYQELSKLMHEFEVDPGEIGQSNVGYDDDFNFKILDSSIFEHTVDNFIRETKKKKACKPSKGKRFAKRVDGKCRSFGQAGQAKSGGDRIRPGTKKGDAYCARSAGIKKCKNPPCANTLSRKKWKCRGKKSMKEGDVIDFSAYKDKKAPKSWKPDEMLLIIKIEKVVNDTLEEIFGLEVPEEVLENLESFLQSIEDNLE